MTPYPTPKTVKTCENLLSKCYPGHFGHPKRIWLFYQKEDDPVKKHPITKVYVSAVTDGRIKAKAYRGNSRIEPILFDTVQDFLIR